MGKCQQCGKIVNTTEMTYGYCSECITPELEQEGQIQYEAIKLKKVSLVNQQSGTTKEVPIGGSILNFLFYPIIPFVRKDWGFAAIGSITLILGLVLHAKIILFFYALFMGLQYNKLYIKRLLKQGYIPANDVSKKLLEFKKISI